MKLLYSKLLYYDICQQMEKKRRFFYDIFVQIVF